MLNRLSPDQLQETVTSIDPTGLHEEATDVVSSNASPSAQIDVDIPPSRQGHSQRFTKAWIDPIR